MSAYVVGHITVKDPQKWKRYRERVPETLTAWGGEVVLRGHRIAVLSGEHAHNDTVVIRFPHAEAVSGWYSSAEYQALIPLREEAAQMVLICYESDADLLSSAPR
jgi:uncharacterized protein (DUF1330 family)